MLGIVIPCYNRLNNLRLCFQSLEQQSYHEFEVVIADDGSTDRTREYVERLSQTPHWQGRLRYVNCGPNMGVRTGRARNIGTANLSLETTALVMLDTDVILGPETMAAYAAYTNEDPTRIILGRTDWLPPMDLSDINRRMISEGVAALKSHVPDGTPKRIEGTFVGQELRQSIVPELWQDRDIIYPYKAQFALPLNSCYPLPLYWQAGGHDEKLSGYGFQDMVFGFHVEQLGVNFLASPKAWALHIWHLKNDPLKRHFEAQRNLDYLIRKYTSNTVFDGEIDWTVWWHYHKQRGGKFAIIHGETYAVNHAGTHRLKLAKNAEEWLEQLSMTEVNQIPEETALLATDMGPMKPIGIEDFKLPAAPHPGQPPLGAPGSNMT